MYFYRTKVRYVIILVSFSNLRFYRKKEIQLAHTQREGLIERNGRPSVPYQRLLLATKHVCD